MNRMNDSLWGRLVELHPLCAGDVVLVHNHCVGRARTSSNDDSPTRDGRDSLKFAIAPGTNCPAPLDLPDHLVGEEDQAVTDGLGIDEAHGLLVACLAEEALTRPQDHREDDQPQLVDQVMRD
jgi:hypothetical protein